MLRAEGVRCKDGRKEAGMDFNEAVDFGVTADSGERMDFDGALKIKI